jgi:hypothetical protein
MGQPNTTREILYPQVVVQLTGEDGNASSIIGRVAAAIRAGVGSDEADAYALAAMMCGSYDELLALTQEIVTVR